MLSDKFLFTVICEVVFFSGRYYLMSDPKLVLFKLIPPLLLELFLIYKQNYLYVLEFMFYIIGDYFLFFVHNLAEGDLTFGMIAFICGHIVAIYDLNFENLRSYFWFTMIWFICGILIGLVASNIENRQLNMIINLYILIITLRLTLTIAVDFHDSISITLFCISDLLILANLLHFHGSNEAITSGILITYWISLILRAKHISDINF